MDLITKLPGLLKAITHTIRVMCCLLFFKDGSHQSFELILYFDIGFNNCSLKKVRIFVLLGSTDHSECPHHTLHAHSESGIYCHVGDS